MSNLNKNSKKESKNSNKQNFFLPKETGANADSPSSRQAADKDDNVSAKILAELKSFRRENNDQMTEITSAITSLEQSVEKMGERLTHAEDRINQVEEGSARSARLLGYLLRRERQLEDRCEELENFTRRNNLRVYGIKEGSERGDMVQWTSSFLRDLLELPLDTVLQIERAHRSLQQKPGDEDPPRSLIVRFVNHQEKQLVLTKAWNTKNLQYNGRKIYMDHDYSPALQKRRREYVEIKKQLKDRNIKFQTPYPAKLKVHLKDGIQTYTSAWEAAEDLALRLGIRTSMSEVEKLDKELNRVGWQLAGGPRRGEIPTHSLIRDMEALQKD